MVIEEKPKENQSIEELLSSINTGELSGKVSSLNIAAPRPSAIYRRKWLLKAVNMSSCFEMSVDV